MLADLDGLRLSLLFLDECPVTWSRFHACVKGQERSLVTQALVGPRRLQHSCCLWWLCFDQLPSLHLDGPLNQKASPAGRGGGLWLVLPIEPGMPAGHLLSAGGDGQ